LLIDSRSWYSTNLKDNFRFVAVSIAGLVSLPNVKLSIYRQMISTMNIMKINILDCKATPCMWALDIYGVLLLVDFLHFLWSQSSLDSRESTSVDLCKSQHPGLQDFQQLGESSDLEKGE
jgi:hypothetical protein